MIRTIGAVIGGLAGWELVVLFFAVIVQPLWPSYAAVTNHADFTLAMLLGRLTVAALATLVGGAVALKIARDRKQAAPLFALALIVLSLPQHTPLAAYCPTGRCLAWTGLPLWYHGVYLASLIPMALLGGLLAQRRPWGKASV